MLTRNFTLKFNLIVLGLAALMDINRGIAHTFRVNDVAVKLAGIEPIPDSLFLMGAFGISNFLTGFLYFLIIWKAKELAPYVLLLIPFSYFLGGMGIRFQQVQPEAPFIGQYMMAVYLGICLVSGLLFFLSKKPKVEYN